MTLRAAMIVALSHQRGGGPVEAAPTWGPFSGARQPHPTLPLEGEGLEGPVAVEIAR